MVPLCETNLLSSLAYGCCPAAQLHGTSSRHQTKPLNAEALSGCWTRGLRRLRAPGWRSCFDLPWHAICLISMSGGSGSGSLM